MGEVTSEWLPITSSVVQGSVLGPILFVIYINDLPDHLNNICKMYADDNKVLSKIEEEKDAQMFQQDINRLCLWSNEWLLKFNIEKCHIMHFGKNNPKFKYSMQDRKLNESIIERDIGVFITNDLKSTNHVKMSASKANKMLGLLLNTFNYLDLDTFKVLYNSYVRPQLEFGVSAWNPYLRKDIEILERVQRRATKKAPGLSGYEYEERLKILGLTTLEERRVRGDLIQQFKIVNGIERVKWHHPPTFKAEQSREGPASGVRGHKYSYHKDKFNDGIRLNFFNNRIANDWNVLPDEVVNSRSVNSFKAKIDKIYDKNGTYKRSSKKKQADKADFVSDEN